MYSLSALSKFLGIHREFKSLRESYGLKWSKGNTDQLIIKRLLRGKNGDELGDWIREVKNRIPGISNFVDLLLSTGLRYCEAINAYNLIMDDREDYYRDSFLEHYRYPTLFIRRTKKVFVSIVPSSLVNRISKSDRLTDDMIKKRLQRRKIPLRFSDIRELWASRMTRYLTQPEIDFLMGHVSANVFMANYFNIALITDLRKRTLRGINRIL